MGCSVITTKTGAIHELLGDVATYVDPYNQESINKAFTDVLKRDIYKAIKSLFTKQSTMQSKLFSALQ